jgi:hypothetical protein
MKAGDGRQPVAKESYVNIKKIAETPQVESGLKVKTHLKAGLGELVQGVTIRPIALCG